MYGAGARLPLPRKSCSLDSTDCLGEDVYVLEFDRGSILFDRSTFEVRLLGAVTKAQAEDNLGRNTYVMVSHIWVHPHFIDNYLVENKFPDYVKLSLHDNWDEVWKVFLTEHELVEKV